MNQTARTSPLFCLIEAVEGICFRLMHLIGLCFHRLGGTGHELHAIDKI